LLLLLLLWQPLRMLAPLLPHVVSVRAVPLLSLIPLLLGSSFVLSLPGRQSILVTLHLRLRLLLVVPGRPLGIRPSAVASLPRLLQLLLPQPVRPIATTRTNTASCSCRDQLTLVLLQLLRCSRALREGAMDGRDALMRQARERLVLRRGQLRERHSHQHRGPREVGVLALIPARPARRTIHQTVRHDARRAALALAAHARVCRGD
jgi:hypothetical protein